MALQKDTVLSKLKAAKQTLGLNVTDKLLDSLAEDLKDHYDTDEDLNTFLDGAAAKAMLKAAANEGDRRATQATKVKPTDTPKPDEPAKADDGKDELIKQLVERMDRMEQTKTTETVQASFLKAAKEAGLPEVIYEGRTPASLEEVAPLVQQLKTGFDAYTAQSQTSRFGKDHPVPTGGSSPSQGAGKVDPDIVAYGKAKATEATKTS